ncbi:MAG: TonB-dependent receptor [Pseudomonadota bacterium]|nr:TonB-dependent receptor [Pseudomonadota bacterium]
MTRMPKQYLGAVSALAVAVSLAAAGGAAAQVSTSTIRGSVTEGAQAEAGAAVVARDVASGFTNRATANAEGNFVLSGLRPGTYEITVTTTDGQTASEVVSVGVGQVGEVALEIGGEIVSETTTTDIGDVVVVGRRLVEVRTPENATNVTTQQIESLPQINRNFLNFAALAPGVRVSQNQEEQTITAGGQRAESVNAFIDGASLKSNVIAGGLAGQDDSRGNPFPQAAIQEFRVVSQNFKAEYEQASSAIITAVTRSGTNEFSGEIFGTYRDESFITQDEFAKRRGEERADLTVKQYGAALGGPIIRDRLHFFGSYERKEENRASVVNLGRQDQRFTDLFGQYIGTYATPFEEDLYFGKLSWQPADAHLVDLSVTYRDEFDTRGIGGANSVERATELNQNTLSSNLRWQFQGNSFLNELAVDYRKYNYNPQPVNFSAFGESYNIFEDSDPATPGVQINPERGIGILNLGGSDSRQDIVDEALTIREDLTFNDVEWKGFHTIKMGAKYSMQNYQVTKEFQRNPLFFYDLDGRPETSGDPDVPYRVELGRPLPAVDLKNNVIGLYIQDDWRITDQLELNLGIRWDYEDNANNNDYTTPQSIRDGVAQLQAQNGGYLPSFFNEEDYFADGDRESFKGAFQPRIGFSYDVFGDRSTVIFGGAGRYYDRVQFNFSFDEFSKPSELRQNAYFSTTGRPVGEVDPVRGLPGDPGDPILWDPSYATVEGLDPVFQTIPGRGEVFMLQNEFEPPRTDQFNLGVRQRFGDWQTELTLAYGQTANEFTWLYLARCREGGVGDNGGFCGPNDANPYRGYFVSDHNKERDWTAVYLKLDKAYTRDSGWGLNVAATWSESNQNGTDDFFAFDFFDIESSPDRYTDNDERVRIVANGIVDLPLDFQLSGILTLGTGTPYDIQGTGGLDIQNGFRGERQNFLIPDAFAYRNLDLRLTKTIPLWNEDEVQIFVDAINVFNFSNYNAYNRTLYNFPGGVQTPNPAYGTPTGVAFPTRTFQIGMRYSF